MIALRFELLAGRLHATPWDAHVNEGQVEWPPSPWRLLRALVAASYRLSERDEARVRTLVLRLADELPHYRLPAVTLTHTRAYLTQHSGREGKKVFDAFAVAERPGEGEVPHLDVAWPGIRLSIDERALLVEIVGQVGYLGRAESWVQAHVLDELPGWPDACVAEPASDGELTVWAPTTAEAFDAWREGFLAAGGKAKEIPAGRYEALGMETQVLHKERWSGPPGARRVAYSLRGPGPMRRPRATGAGMRPEVARFALVAPVLPKVERTLIFGERLRRALMARAERAGPDVMTLFSGRDADGPLKGNRHAHFLPVDDDGDGRIDHLVVWSPVGFDDAAVDVLRRLTFLWAERGASPTDQYDVRLVALGSASTLGGVDTERRDPARTATVGESRVWRSETPFVPFRHPKRRGEGWVDLPADQVVRAVGHLDHLRGVAPPEVRVATGRDAEVWARAFIRTRKEGGGSLGSPKGERVELRFAEPVRGPILLGYGAHFGLGCFRAVAL